MHADIIVSLRSRGAVVVIARVCYGCPSPYLRVDPLGNPTGTAFAGRLWHGGLLNGTQPKTDRRRPRDHGIGAVMHVRMIGEAGAKVSRYVRL